MRILLEPTNIPDLHMPTQLTSEDFKQSLTAHVAAKGEELFQKYGPHIGWKELRLILDDRAFCRYPCEIVFDASELQPGEFAHPVAKGARPEEGFAMHVQPAFMTQLAQVPYLVLYQLVAVNYGEFASAEDAETFGSSALGILKEEYYNMLCQLADQLCEM
jgi:hypothetical protein